MTSKFGHRRECLTRQLNLNRDQLDQCYNAAQRLVSHAAKYLDRHSSRAVERASLLLLGVEGEYRGVPLATLLVETLTKDQLRLGAAYWWGRAILSLKQPAAGPKEKQELAEKLGRGKLKWSEIPEAPPPAVKKEMEHAAKESLHRFEKHKSHKHFWQQTQGPRLALRLTDGKARRLPAAAAEWHKKGAHILVLDSPNKKFFEETFESEELKPAFENMKDIPAVAVLRGLSLPEQTWLAVGHGVQTLSPEGWLAALTGEVDSKRALIDLSFSLSLAKKSGAHLFSEHSLFGEKFPQHFQMPHLLAALLLYEQLAVRQGVSLENIVLSASPVGAGAANDFAGLLAGTQVLREMFPQSFLWYRLSGALNPFSFLSAAMTEQDVLEVSPEELPRAKEWLKNLEGIGRDLSMNTYGRIGRQAHQILEQTYKILKQMEHQTLWKVFDDDFLKTKAAGAKNLGQEGVFQKSYHYFNPVVSLCQGSASS